MSAAEKPIGPSVSIWMKSGRISWIFLKICRGKLSESRISLYPKNGTLKKSSAETIASLMWLGRCFLRFSIDRVTPLTCSEVVSVKIRSVFFIQFLPNTNKKTKKVNFAFWFDFWEKINIFCVLSDIRVISSVGESICLTSRGSGVRIPHHPPYKQLNQIFIKTRKILIINKIISIWR